jgi:hypothetical protein
MPRLLMIDSGAFSVWKGGLPPLDVHEYIRFCQAVPEASYYVNLDIIPGRPGDRGSYTKDNVNEACEGSWRNYRAMLRELPKGKVIPVYHQNDPIRWLDKYLDSGAPYIGISATSGRGSVRAKRQWMNWRHSGLRGEGDSIRRRLFDGAGRPTVKTHGFAMTAFSIMDMPGWEWHSVDSTSWMQCAAWGGVYFPETAMGAWNYRARPTSIYTSPRSPQRTESVGRNPAKHIESLNGESRERFLAYLKQARTQLGVSKVITVGPEYKRKSPDLWLDKKARTVIKVIELGVINCQAERLFANAYYMKQANKLLPVDHIYLAGTPRPYVELEEYVGKRLLSYHMLGLSPDDKCLQVHLRMIRKYKETRK